MNRTVTMQQSKRATALNIRTTTMTALLSALAYVLAFVEFPAPLFPSFAKMDLSDFPVLIGCAVASFAMGFATVLTKYFILLPLFETFMPLDQLIASFDAFLPFIHTKLDIVLLNGLLFNILKGLIIGGFTMLTYKRVTPILKGR